MLAVRTVQHTLIPLLKDGSENTAILQLYHSNIQVIELGLNLRCSKTNINVWGLNTEKRSCGITQNALAHS